MVFGGKKKQTGFDRGFKISGKVNNRASRPVYIKKEPKIEPEQFLVLFRPGTTLVRSGLGTFFVPEPEHTKHFLSS